ncbi:hypothetical protein L9F63_019065, partial [Diploptera punctata]
DHMSCLHRLKKLRLYYFPLKRIKNGSANALLRYFRAPAGYFAPTTQPIFLRPWTISHLRKGAIYHKLFSLFILLYPDCSDSNSLNAWLLVVSWESDLLISHILTGRLFTNVIDTYQRPTGLTAAVQQSNSGTHLAEFFLFFKSFVRIKNIDIEEMPMASEITVPETPAGPISTSYQFYVRVRSQQKKKKSYNGNFFPELEATIAIKINSNTFTNVYSLQKVLKLLLLIRLGCHFRHFRRFVISISAVSVVVFFRVCSFQCGPCSHVLIHRDLRLITYKRSLHFYDSEKTRYIIKTRMQCYVVWIRFKPKYKFIVPKIRSAENCGCYAYEYTPKLKHLYTPTYLCNGIFYVPPDKFFRTPYIFPFGFLLSSRSDNTTFKLKFLYVCCKIQGLSANFNSKTNLFI